MFGQLIHSKKIFSTLASRDNQKSHLVMGDEQVYRRCQNVFTYLMTHKIQVIEIPNIVDESGS